MKEEIKRKISETKKRKYASGEIIVWNKGKNRPPFSEEWRKNLSKALKGKKNSSYAISKLIERNKTRNPMWDPEIVKKATAKRNYQEIAKKTTLTKLRNGVFIEYSKRMKLNNPMKNPIINAKVNKNPEVIKKRIQALIKNPNKKESLLLNLIKQNNLSYKFVGDSKFILGTKNPDFVDIKNKKIIEVFGDYWHTKKARCYEETEKGRIEYFTKFGYNTLVIWEKELKDIEAVLIKVLKFNENKNI